MKKQFAPIHNQKYYYIAMVDLVIRCGFYNSFDFTEQVHMRRYLKHKIVFKTMKDARLKLRKIKKVLNGTID